MGGGTLALPASVSCVVYLCVLQSTGWPELGFSAASTTENRMVSPNAPPAPLLQPVGHGLRSAAACASDGEWATAEVEAIDRYGSALPQKEGSLCAYIEHVTRLQ
jgi:hypothetical protein